MLAYTALYLLSTPWLSAAVTEADTDTGREAATASCGPLLLLGSYLELSRYQIGGVIRPLTNDSAALL